MFGRSTFDMDSLGAVVVQDRLLEIRIWMKVKAMGAWGCEADPCLALSSGCCYHAVDHYGPCDQMLDALQGAHVSAQTGKCKATCLRRLRGGLASKIIDDNELR